MRTGNYFPGMCASAQNRLADASTLNFDDRESHAVSFPQPHEETMMDTITLRPSPGNQPEWKTQDYHGKGIHVCTALRVNRNNEISGHGQQWDFKVRVTDQGTGPTAHE